VTKRRREKDFVGEGTTGLNAPVTHRRTGNKRPTIAQLRELNRALKDVAPIPLTLRRTEAVVDLSVLDLETQSETDEDRESKSEGNEVGTPSSGTTVSFEKMEHIKYIEPRGFLPPEEPNTPRDQKKRTKPEITLDKTIQTS